MDAKDRLIDGLGNDAIELSTLLVRSGAVRAEGVDPWLRVARASRTLALALRDAVARW